MRSAPYILLVMWLFCSGCQKKSIQHGPVFYGSSELSAIADNTDTSTGRKGNSKFIMAIEVDSLKPTKPVDQQAKTEDVPTQPETDLAEAYQLRDSFEKASSLSKEKPPSSVGIILRDTLTVNGRQVYADAKETKNSSQENGQAKVKEQEQSETRVKTEIIREGTKQVNPAIPATAAQIVYVRDSNTVKEQQAILSRLDELSRELKQLKTPVMVPVLTAGKNPSGQSDTTLRPPLKTDTAYTIPSKSDSLFLDSIPGLPKTAGPDYRKLAEKNDLEYLNQRLQFIETQLAIIVLKLDTLPTSTRPLPTAAKPSEQPKDIALRDSINTLMKLFRQQQSKPVADSETPPVISTNQEMLYIFFRVNSSTLQPEFREMLRKSLNGKNPASVVLKGYADPSGNAAYNEQLSQQRAEAVATFLTAQLGIANSKITVKVFGENESTKATGAAYERRVEVQVAY